MRKGTSSWAQSLRAIGDILKPQNNLFDGTTVLRRSNKALRLEQGPTKLGALGLTNYAVGGRIKMTANDERRQKRAQYRRNVLIVAICCSVAAVLIIKFDVFDKCANYQIMR